MTDSDQTASDPAAELLQRPDEDDQDLLTYSEAGVRLQEEIAALRRRVETLRAGSDPESLRTAEERLAMLEDGQARHARQWINDENFEAFFGYAGRARRLTEEK